MSSSFSDLEICLLNSESRKLSDIHENIADLVENVSAGNFKEALESQLAKELLTLSTHGSLEENGTPLTSSFRFEVSNLSDPKDIEACRLAVAVACLQAFLQENWTGPPVDLPVSALLSTSLSDEVIRAKSISELALGGEPVYHLTKLPILLRISQLLLQLPYKHFTTAAWWSRRAATVHQLILDEPVPFEIPTLEPVFEIASRVSPDLAGQIILEEGLVHHHFTRDKEAFECFSRAAQVMGLEYEVTGALGVKTKFQDNPLSQLVLLARSRGRGSQTSDASATASDGKAAVPEALLLNDDTLLEQTKFTAKTFTSSSKLSDLDPSNQLALHPLDQCVLLGMCLNVRNTSPAHGLTSEQMMPYVTRVIANPKNWSIHTMALLLRSRLEATRTRTVERSTLQLQQLVEQMPSNDSSAKERLLYFHTLPLPSKWELERELALRYTSLGITKSALEIFERLEMWEEVVRCWGSMERPDKGVAIIQDLLAGRKQESEVVTYRSKATSEEKLSKLDSAREAKLWCLLGDLEPQNAEEHYQKAWIISGERSGRAIRSLGGYYFARNNFPEAIRCLRLAVAINPLLSRSWFILGCACVREEKWKDARDAFARCVAIDEEDAESWSNLASVYLKLEPGALEDRNDDSEFDGETKRQPSFDSKVLAFRALQRGVKFGHENWRMWINYMIVSMDVGELSEATRALGRIVEQRVDQDKEKCVDVEVLERLVHACGKTVDDEAEGDTSEPRYIRANEGAALARRVFDLIERQILPRISSSPRIFRAYARLLMSQARYGEALQAHMNAYRLTTAGGGAASEGTSMGGINTSEEWREAVSDVQDIVDVLRNLGPKARDEQKRKSHASPIDSLNGGISNKVEGNDMDVSGSGETAAAKSATPRNWVLQARSILRSFLGRTRRDFEDEPEFSQLQELMEEIKTEAAEGE